MSVSADPSPDPSPELTYLERGFWGTELLHEYALRAAATNGDRVAVVAGDRRTRYGELVGMVDRVAGAFLAAGLCRGDNVVVRLPNSHELIVTLLGLARAGMVPVLMPPNHGRRELDHIVALTEARGLILASRPDGGSEAAIVDLRKTADVAFAALRSSRPVDRELAVDLAAFLDSAPDEGAPPPAGRGPGDVAVQLMSSGTTGLPKAIGRTHQAYVYSVEVSVPLSRVDADTRYLAALPIAHNFSLGSPGVFGVLASGGQVVVGGPTVGEIGTLVARERVTMTSLVPGLAKALVGSDADLSSLRLLQVGGAKLYEADAHQILARLGPGSLQQVFGITEGVLNYTRPTDPDEVVAVTQGRLASPGDEWAIVDPLGRPVAPGEAGELLVRGPYSIRSYTRAPEADAEAFTPDGFYRTGDVVRQHPSGNFVVEGRRRDFVNRGGEKIATSEIESLLAGCPDVADAAAVPMPHEFLGEVVCLFVVPGDASEPPDLRAVRRYLRGVGLASHGLPERVEILDRIPTNAVGKPDRAALTRLAATLAP